VGQRADLDSLKNRRLASSIANRTPFSWSSCLKPIHYTELSHECCLASYIHGLGQTPDFLKRFEVLTTMAVQSIVFLFVMACHGHRKIN
jgi:hypothetical protein